VDTRKGGAQPSKDCHHNTGGTDELNYQWVVVRRGGATHRRKGGATVVPREQDGSTPNKNSGKRFEKTLKGLHDQHTSTTIRRKAKFKEPGNQKTRCDWKG